MSKFVSTGAPLIVTLNISDPSVVKYVSQKCSRT
jgi:hypothetical protein